MAADDPAEPAELGEEAGGAMSTRALIHRIEQAENRLRRSIASRLEPPRGDAAAAPGAPLELAAAERGRSPRAESPAPPAEPAPPPPPAAAPPPPAEREAGGDEARLLLIMSIDIGDGRSASIEIREGDEPEVLAATFAAEHDLPPAAHEALAGHVRAHVEQATAESAAAEARVGAEERAERSPSPRARDAARQPPPPPRARDAQHGGGGGGGAIPPRAAPRAPEREREPEAGAAAAAHDDALLGSAEIDGEDGDGQLLISRLHASEGRARRAHAARARSVSPQSARAGAAAGRGVAAGGGEASGARGGTPRWWSGADEHEGLAAADDDDDAPGYARSPRAALARSWLEHTNELLAARPRRRGAAIPLSPGGGAGLGGGGGGGVGGSPPRGRSPARSEGGGARRARRAAHADADGAGGAPHERLLAEAAERRARADAARAAAAAERARALSDARDAARVHAPDLPAHPAARARRLREIDSRTAELAAARRAAAAAATGVPPTAAVDARLHAEGARARARRAEARAEAEQRALEAEAAARVPELARPSPSRRAAVASRPAPWESLGERRRASERQRAALLARAEQRRMAECTFRPRLDARSARLAAGRARSAGRAHDADADHAPNALLEDARRRAEAAAAARARERDARAAAERTFALGGREAAAGASRRPLSPARAAHYERLALSRAEAQQEVAMLRAYLHAPVDRATGARLFNPATGRAPKGHARTAGDGAVFGELYADARQSQAARAHAERAASDAAARDAGLTPAARDASLARAGARTERAVASLRARRLRSLFELLCECQRGGGAAGEAGGGGGGAAADPAGPRLLFLPRVDWAEVGARVAAAGAPPAVAADVRAVLGGEALLDAASAAPGSPAARAAARAAEEAARPYPFDEFVATLAPRVREIVSLRGSAPRTANAVRLLLGEPTRVADGAPGAGAWGSRSEDGALGMDASELEELTFAPALTRHTRALAFERRAGRGEAGARVYDRLHLDREERRARLAAEQQAAAEAEMEGVTFAPRLDARSERIASRTGSRAEPRAAEASTIYERLYTPGPTHTVPSAAARTGPQAAAALVAELSSPRARTGSPLGAGSTRARSGGSARAPISRAATGGYGGAAGGAPSPPRRPAESSAVAEARAAAARARERADSRAAEALSGGHAPAVVLSRQLARLMSPRAKLPPGAHGTKAEPRATQCTQPRAAHLTPSPARAGSSAPPGASGQPPGASGVDPDDGDGAGAAAGGLAEDESAGAQPRNVEDRFYAALAQRLGARPS